ncbi:lipase family protein [Nostocoides sp.]|uniref:lipase family protein n=1 Tax=Nostocoides sp. TaxID=1917966 RepID=UPI002BD50082|nr:lipase family protein [Tetrasphaera sp.]
MRTLIMTALTAAALAAAPAAGAYAADEPSRPIFYDAPAVLPAGNGAIIRTEPLSYAVDPAGLSSLAVTSTRVLYTSTDRAGERIAVSGSVIVPKAPWIGFGKRPVIGYAVGTQGMADRCAPSRMLSEGFEYEGVFIKGLLARGYAIAMTDYEGLGTAGVHTYMNRAAQGHAVLDMVRAAQKLPGSGLSGQSPVGLVGYSQGGGATASAAELAASYAPELRVLGAVAGAVPADLQAVAANLDGSLWAEFGLYGFRGLAAAYDLDLAPFLNSTGRTVMDAVEGECVTDLANHAFIRSATLTADGQSVVETMKRAPFAAMVADQRLGTIRPAMPVLVTHSMLDDTIPFAVGKSMAASWCSKGAKVRFSPNVTPLHIGGMLNNSAEQYSFLEARFAGLPMVSNCWTL